MNCLKQTLALVLSCAVFTMCFPFAASAADNTLTYTDESGVVYTYTVDGDEAEIIKIETSRSTLSIPETIDGYTVVRLGELCCDENKNINIVTIPGTVTEIGDEAFAECTYIYELNLSDGLEVICDGAFYNCPNISEVVIPNTVKSLGNACFSLCAGLKTVTIPDSVTNIGNAAFSGCKNLTSVIWNRASGDVNSSAFSGTPWFRGLRIPKSTAP